MFIGDMANLFPKVGNNINMNVQTEPMKITNIPRKMYTIRNFTPGATLYVGFTAEVDASTGFPVLGGEVVYLNTAADLYLVSDQDEDNYCDSRIMIMS
jgi:hypothetical protein